MIRRTDCELEHGPSNRSLKDPGRESGSGIVHSINDDISLTTWREISTRNGEEAVSGDCYFQK
jgi:hypothetical protein